MSGLDPAEAIARAAEVGVTRIVQIGCDPDDSRWAVEAAERWPGVVAGVAIHPNDAARMGPDLVDGARGDRGAGAASAGPGRGGDGPGLLPDDRRRTAGEVQKEAFAAHIAFAKTYDKTLVIHDRDAHAEVLDVLDAEGPPGPHRDALLLRRRRVRPGVPEPRGLPVVRRNGHVQGQRANCGRRSAWLRWTGSWSRRMRRI